MPRSRLVSAGGWPARAHLVPTSRYAPCDLRSCVGMRYRIRCVWRVTGPTRHGNAVESTGVVCEAITT